MSRSAHWVQIINTVKTYRSCKVLSLCRVSPHSKPLLLCFILFIFWKQKPGSQYDAFQQVCSQDSYCSVWFCATERRYDASMAWISYYPNLGALGGLSSKVFPSGHWGEERPIFTYSVQGAYTNELILAFIATPWGKQN